MKGGKRLMTSAEKMFKELGYVKGSFLENIVYETEDGEYVITFWTFDKTFDAQKNIEPKDITMEELKAIIQQLKELGWYE